MKDGKIYGCPRESPTTAADWAKTCNKSALHTGENKQKMCCDCADAYAREQVTAASVTGTADVLAAVVAERDRLLDEFSATLKKRGMTPQRQVYPFDDAVDALVRQQVEAALEKLANHTAKGFTGCVVCKYVSEAGHREDCLLATAIRALP